MSAGVDLIGILSASWLLGLLRLDKIKNSDTTALKAEIAALRQAVEAQREDKTAKS
jgi:hypothetical protein